MGGTSLEEVSAGVELIREHCKRIGRSADEIDVRCSLPLVRRDDGRGDITATVRGAADLVLAGATVVQLPPLTQFVSDTTEAGGLMAEAVTVLRTELG